MFCLNGFITSAPEYVLAYHPTFYSCIAEPQGRRRRRLSHGTSNHKQARAESILAHFSQEVRINIDHQDNVLMYSDAPITNLINHSDAFCDWLRERIQGNLT